MISKWILKAIVQKSISYLPQPERLNYFFQKYVTKGALLSDTYFRYKIEHAAGHIAYLNKYPEKKSGRVVVELGTGWYPIIPVIFFLTDSADKVISLDIRNWMNKEKKLRTVEKLIEWRNNGKLEPYALDINEEKWNSLVNIGNSPSDFSDERINEVIGLEQLIQDARNLDLEDMCIDFICSNNTLEHIPKEILSSIFSEFKRILKPTGLMNHYIDCTDHFAHFDQRITIYNFLKYSRKTWSLIDNKIQPQNRLRFVDYKNMLEQLDIPVTEEDTLMGDASDLQKVKVHKEFHSYSEKELLVSHGNILSSMADHG